MGFKYFLLVWFCRNIVGKDYQGQFTETKAKTSENSNSAFISFFDTN